MTLRRVACSASGGILGEVVSESLAIANQSWRSEPNNTGRRTRRFYLRRSSSLTAGHHKLRGASLDLETEHLAGARPCQSQQQPRRLQPDLPDHGHP